MANPNGPHDSKGQFAQTDCLARFWGYVDARGPGECWEWHGTTLTYGHFWTGKRIILVHRFSWELHNAQEIPDGVVVRHICDNPLCVNPAHLVLGTHADNMRDMVRRDRQAKGCSVASAKLTPDDVREIRELRKAGMTYRQISQRYGVCKKTPIDIVHGRTWAWLE